MAQEAGPAAEVGQGHERSREHPSRPQAPSLTGYSRWLNPNPDEEHTLSLSELREAVAELSDVNESAVTLLSGVADLLEQVVAEPDTAEGGVEAEVAALAAQIREQTAALAAAVAAVPAFEEPAAEPEPSPGDVLAEQGVDAPAEEPVVEPDAPTTETVSDETNAPVDPEPAAEAPPIRDI